MAGIRQRQTTLGKWLIDKVNTADWRAGKVAGVKHPVVDQKMIDAIGLKNLLSQAASLEREGLIRVDWKSVGGDIGQIHFDVEKMDALCIREGVENPRRRMERACAVVRKWRGLAKETWLTEFYDELLLRIKEGKLPQNAKDEDLFSCLNALAALRHDTWKRVFSVGVFGDSKRFEREYEKRVLTVLKKYSPLCLDDMEDAEILAEHRIMTYSQTLEWKGPVTYCISTEEKKTIVDTSGMFFGAVLNAQTLSHAFLVSAGEIREVVTIENKANYENMEYDSKRLYIYTHGFFSPKERIFLKKLCEILPDTVRYCHWGDMDYGGIRIFQFIRRTVFPGLEPLYMDSGTYRRAIESGAGILLEDEKRKKLEKLDAGVLEELKLCILESGLEVEQEALMSAFLHGNAPFTAKNCFETEDVHTYDS